MEDQGPSTYLTPQQRRTRGSGGSARRGGRFNRRRPRYQAPAIPRGLNIREHLFKQMYRPSAANLTISSGATGTAYDPAEGILFGPDPASTAGDGFFSLKFTVGDLTQVASFGAIFDAYRINKCVVKFIPFLSALSSGSISNASTASFDENLVTVLDYDDSTPLTSLQAAEEYETYKMTPGYRQHVRSLVPAVALNAFRTGGSTIAYTQRTKQWCDANTSDVEHYGIKGVIQGPSTAANARRQAWWVRVKMYVSYKQVR